MIDETKNFDFGFKPIDKKINRISNPKKEPLISIITAYYNKKENFRETVQSVLNQSFPYWEWIIVNDGSTEDGTEEFLKEIEESDSRIKVFSKKNEGQAIARDYAISKCAAKYISNMDADDILHETFLECGYFSLITNPDASILYCNQVAFDQDEYLYSKSFDFNLEKKENLICGNAIVKKEDLLSVGGYSKSERYVHEDWHLWLRMLKEGFKPIRMNYYGFWYRIGKGVLHDITTNSDKNKYADKVISNLADTLHNKVDAIEFPVVKPFEFTYDAYTFDEFSMYKPYKYERKKKQLLFILPWFVTGGADIFNIELLKKLDKDKYDITVVTTEASKYVLRSEAEKYATVFDLTTFLKQEDWAAFLHYLIKSRNIDLVMVSNSFYGYYVLPWLKAHFPNKAFVDYLHAQDFSWRNGGYPQDSNAICGMLEKTFTCTKLLKNIMLDKMNRRVDNIMPVYIGVDKDKFNCENPDIKPINYRGNLDFCKGKKVILFPCRIVELKRPIFVLRVLEKLLKSDPNYILFVVGFGEQYSEMEKYVKKLNLNNNVVFFGNQVDVRPFYKRADVTLITSLTEGLTLTAYESLAMGVPVVSSDVGGQKELIDDSCGRIIKSYQSVEKDLFNRNYSEEEIDEFVNAIVDVVNKENISKSCIKRIESDFSTDKMVSILSNQFDEIIKNVKSNNYISIETANNYLKMFLQLYPLYVKPEIYKRNYKLTLRGYLWEKKWYRNFIDFCKRTGLVKIKKKLFK